LRFAVGADSVAGLEQLARAMSGSSARLRVVIEVDPHYGRTGVEPGAVAEIGRAVERRGFELLGLFSHGGHAYAGGDAIAAAARDELEALTTGAAALRTAGIEPQVLSAGSSPTALGVLSAPVTDVRPGTYLIGDRMQVALGASPADGVAIAVAATVVSTAVDGQVVINAGAKSLTKDLPPYLAGYGWLPDYPHGVIERVTDYHGQVRFPSGAPQPALGEIVAVIPNHACPTIDLCDSFAATRSGSLVGRWTVDARGRSG
jgi:D-serine deaminase-like pyridoxal phosphate-dependent protein